MRESFLLLVISTGIALFLYGIGMPLAWVIGLGVAALFVDLLHQCFAETWQPVMRRDHQLPRLQTTPMKIENGRALPPLALHARPRRQSRVLRQDAPLDRRLAGGA
jgi:hypothetical protein